MLFGSVDILARTMRICNRKFFVIVVCYGGRRRNGRSRTPALCSRRPRSLSGGASALPKSFQQTPIHATAVAGHSLSDALRRLDVPRSRGPAGRAPRTAPDLGTPQGARFHYSASLPAASRRPGHRSSSRRNRAPVARYAEEETAASLCGSRCHGLGAGSRQHVLCAADASSRAKTAAVAALAEMADRGGFGSAVPVVAVGPTRPLERLCESARGRRSRFARNAHRLGAGRRLIRQREESLLHARRTGSTECDSGEAREENLAPPRSASGDAAGISPTNLSPASAGREHLLGSEAETIGSCAGPQLAHAEASSPAARLSLQHLPAVGVAHCREDVNRAMLFLRRPWAQEVRGSNPRAPTTYFFVFNAPSEIGRASCRER